MSIYAIGDIHGQLTKLNGLLEALPLRPDDELVFLGDYVDRGPDSRGVIQRLIELDRSRYCVFLRGNHEDMFLDFLNGCKGYDRDMWMINGGMVTLRSYGVEDMPAPGPVPEVPDEHVTFLELTHYHHLSGGFTFVHAGRMNDDSPIARVRSKVKLWTRSPFYDSPVPWPEGRIIFGHTPFRRPLVTPSAIGIDTLAAYNGPLTAVRLPEVEFYHYPEHALPVDETYIGFSPYD